jgi:hypothetical protein
MELEMIRQTNTGMRCGGRGYWSYFCVTPRDWKEGDLIKKRRLTRIKEKARKWRSERKAVGDVDRITPPWRTQQQAREPPEAEVRMVVGATQMRARRKMPNGYMPAQCAHDGRGRCNAKTGARTGKDYRGLYS